MNYALITGGSSGIGREYARELAAKGWNLIIVSKQFYGYWFLLYVIIITNLTISLI